MIGPEDFRVRIGGFYPQAVSLSSERGSKWKKRRKKFTASEGKSDDDTSNEDNGNSEKNLVLLGFCFSQSWLQSAVKL